MERLGMREAKLTVLFSRPIWTVAPVWVELTMATATALRHAVRKALQPPSQGTT